MSKKTISNILKIDVVAIFAALILWFVTIYPMYKGNFDLANYILLYGMTICCMLVAFYILVGCNKEYGSKLFIVFIYVFAFIELSTLIKHENQSAISIIMTAVRFSCLSLLAQVKDFGAAKSKAVAIILCLTSVVDIVSVINDGALSYAWKGIQVEFVLEISVLLLIIAKYIDKKERGAKI